MIVAAELSHSRKFPSSTTSNSTTCQRAASTCQRAASTCRQAASTCQRAASTCQQAASTFQRAASTFQRAAPTCQQSASTCQRAASTCQHSSLTRFSLLLKRPHIIHLHKDKVEAKGSAEDVTEGDKHVEDGGEAATPKARDEVDCALPEAQQTREHYFAVQQNALGECAVVGTLRLLSKVRPMGRRVESAAFAGATLATPTRPGNPTGCFVAAHYTLLTNAPSLKPISPRASLSLLV